MKYYFIEGQSAPVSSNEIPEGSKKATRDQLIKAFPQTESGAWPIGTYDAQNKLISPVPHRYMNEEEKAIVAKLRGE